MDVDPATQLVYFLDEEAFHDTDRPGFRRRVVTGEHLQLCFWRIDGGASRLVPAPPPRQRAARDRVRGTLDFRIGGPDDEERVVLKAGEVYLAPRDVWHGDSVFIGDDEYGECWILDVFAPRATTCAMADGVDADERADWRLAVDIGGTFTDVVLLDAASGRVVVDKTLTTPAAPLDGVRRGVAAAARQGRRAPGRDHGPDRPRHDAHHQRADRGQDRAGRRS